MNFLVIFCFLPLVRQFLFAGYLVLSSVMTGYIGVKDATSTVMTCEAQLDLKKKTADSFALTNRNAPISRSAVIDAISSDHSTTSVQKKRTKTTSVALLHPAVARSHTFDVLKENFFLVHQENEQIIVELSKQPWTLKWEKRMLFLVLTLEQLNALTKGKSFNT